MVMEPALVGLVIPKPSDVMSIGIAARWSHSLIESDIWLVHVGRVIVTLLSPFATPTKTSMFEFVVANAARVHVVAAPEIER